MVNAESTDAVRGCEMSIEIPLEEFHLLAQAAVNDMRRMARKDAKSLARYKEHDLVLRL